MENATKKLLVEIAHCPIARNCLEGQNNSHRCNEIVIDQQKRLTDFQVPEPWSGDIERAPILFLSSNPSIGSNEAYPVWNQDWTDDSLVDFFVHRFGGGQEKWVKDCLYPLCQNRKEHKKKWVRFWAAIRARAKELLPDVDKVLPGVHYAISEAVHCKSKHEKGVEAALDVCAERYLKRVVSISGAKVIVCLGHWAEAGVRKTFSIREGVKVFHQSVNQHERYFVFLPHPNAREKRSFAGCLGAELGGLQRLLETDAH